MDNWGEELLADRESNLLTGDAEDELSDQAAKSTNHEDSDPQYDYVVDAILSFEVVSAELIDDLTNEAGDEELDDTASEHEWQANEQETPLFPKNFPEQFFGVVRYFLVFSFAATACSQSSSFVGLALRVSLRHRPLNPSTTEIVPEAIVGDNLLLVSLL